jgi:hypothetical protein
MRKRRATVADGDRDKDAKQDDADRDQAGGKLSSLTPAPLRKNGL